MSRKFLNFGVFVLLLEERKVFIPHFAYICQVCFAFEIHKILRLKRLQLLTWLQRYIFSFTLKDTLFVDLWNVENRPVLTILTNSSSDKGS